ncbi:peptidoglycan bridge formation glycyltransferase FemA/FemB family protein [Candidatus Gracilibacteria bacterium]|nr:peptidoglycan bridge formation glycyltransferase FemA/FemB family protein [Candidatus Gracilibacteria bacterium]
MKARILKRSEEAKWDKFIQKNLLASIWQSTEWAHFQVTVPSRGKYWIVVLEENGEIVGGSLIIKHQLGKKYSWLYASRGPQIDYNSPYAKAQMKMLIKALHPIVKSEKAIFLRIDPLLVQEHKNFPNFFSIKHGFQPENTLLLDLTLSEADLLAQMKPKGRYNIKLAKKKGVTIHTSTDIKTFHQLLNETTQRDGFHSHKQAFYENMLKCLGPKAKLYLAKYKNQAIAGLIATTFKNHTIYYYGASSNENRNLMAPYLLQWHAITEAKSHKVTNYDFLGISPPQAENHQWKGVTEFKKKFGGIAVQYKSPQEYAFNPFIYFFYRLYKKLR